MGTNRSTATPNRPKNPARGNQQGQTTLAAKIDRWDGMINNLLPVLGELPQLQPVHAALQRKVVDAKLLRDRLRQVKADAKEATHERKALMSSADELCSRLTLGLRSAFGPKSERLTAFAIKPLKTGRPHKPKLPAAGTEGPTPSASEPAQE
jgi:hypothetical protein